MMWRHRVRKCHSSHRVLRLYPYPPGWEHLYVPNKTPPDPRSYLFYMETLFFNSFFVRI